jgi:hypothetical protein
MWLLVLLDVDDAYSQYLQAGERSSRYTVGIDMHQDNTCRNHLPHSRVSTAVASA